MSRILVPIDFSESSSNSLRYAYSLSKYLGMHLSLIHCYPQQEYNRPYDFKKKDYSAGIKEMLLAFCKEHIDAQTDNIRFFTQAGSVSKIVVALSRQYKLVVMSGNKYDSKIKRWMGSRVSYITSMAQCPVLIIPPAAGFDAWNKIWHIKRKEVETDIIEKYFPDLKINEATIKVKSFKQTSSRSAFWQSVITYIKKPNETLNQAILEASESEQIDLMMLVSHGRGSFQKFLKDDAMQVIFQFNIPVLIFRAASPKNKG